MEKNERMEKFLQQNERVTDALVEFVVRASEKNATSEEVKALSEVAEILFKYCLS